MTHPNAPPAGSTAALIESLLDTLSDSFVARDELRARFEPVLAEFVRRAVEPAKVAHELRNPLAVIETSAFVLAEHLSADARAMRHVNRIRQQTEAANVIVQDLLDALPDRPLAGVAIDAEALAREAVESVKTPEGVVVLIEAPPEKVHVWGEARRLRQVLVNLLQNAYAMDFSGEPLTVAVRVRDDEVELSVRDHGPGVDATVRHHLFELGATARPGGHGLGLFISRQTAERHGGTLSLDTPDGGGARFTLTLPRAAEPT